MNYSFNFLILGFLEFGKERFKNIIYTIFTV